MLGAILQGLLWVAVAGDFYVFNFDNNIVESREVYRGNFQTPFVLFRREGRQSTIEALAEGPPEVLIEGDELQRLKKSLALDRLTMGDRSRKVQLKSGPSIYPGDYYFDEIASLRYFGDHYIDSLRIHLEKAQRSPGQWRGPAYSLFQWVMQNQELAQNSLIISHRAHSEDTWTSFFQTLTNQKEILFSPRPSHVFSLGLPQFTAYGKNSEERKTQLIYDLSVQDLERIPLGDRDLRWNGDGDRKERLHLVVISESQAEVLEALIVKIRKLVTGRHSPIKFVLLYT
ncbi:MAG: hypothetical protein WCH11_07350, partial [Bdellovibrio sp.]